MKYCMKNITYEEYIQNILNARGRFGCGSEYHEKHHIVPKCLGGSDNKDNFIELFAKEHFEAHRLLALENPNNDKLVYAWFAMSHQKNQHQQRYEVSGEEYEEAKQAWCRQYSKSISGERHWDVSGKNNPMYGKRHTEEVRQKISQINKGRPNPMKGKKYSSEFCKKLSEKAKERLKNKKNHNMYGKHHSEETKRKISESQKERLKNPENHPMARKIIRLSDLRVYGYLNKAAQENNIHKSTLIKYCKQHKGFMYYDEWSREQDKISKGGDL